MANQSSGVTASGQLSYPRFTYDEALEYNNTKSDYPKKPEAVAPEYNILLNQKQLDHLVEYLTGDFAAELEEQAKTQKRLEKMKKSDIKDLMDKIKSGKWDSKAPFLPIRPVPDKTQELAPDAVAMLKVSGNRGQDIVLKAVVRKDEDLIDRGSILDFPVILPINETVHEMYAGAFVGTTLNFYAFMSGANPGLGAGGPVLVFKSDGERFGGGVALDEEALFLDE